MPQPLKPCRWLSYGHGDGSGWVRLDQRAQTTAKASTKGEGLDVLGPGNGAGAMTVAHHAIRS
jgi:hypothetical protein